MQQTIHENVEKWLAGSFAEEVKEEIRSMQKDQPDLLADAFYRNLEFGTGGLRGIMGIGTNRMNQYTIGMATQGFANYLNQMFVYHFLIKFYNKHRCWC
jgi:phosphoglucomutase